MAITLTGGATFVGGASIVVPPPGPTEFDFSNASYTFSLWGGDPNVGSVSAFTWGDSGNKFYITDSTYNFREFNCSTPYDFSTTSYVQGNNRPAYDYSRGPDGMIFNKAGTRLVGQADWYFYSYNLSTAWDISSISSLAKANNINAQQGGGVGAGTNYNGVDYNASEDNLFSMVYANVSEVQGFNTSNLPTISYSSSNIKAIGSSPRRKGFAFDKTGDRFIISQQNGPLEIYTMTTPYDITTSSLTGTYDISAINPVGNGIIDIVFSDDYTKVFLLNNGTVTMLSQ